MEFLGCTFECLPVVDIEPGTKVKVQVDFKDIILQDNEEDGTLTGDVRFILYKGDHYHLTVSSDWGEDIFVDTNDVWDNGDHVGISIFPESIKSNSDCRIIIKKRGAQNDTIFLVFT